jgi:hypothetical protein
MKFTMKCISVLRVVINDYLRKFPEYVLHGDIYQDPNQLALICYIVRKDTLPPASEMYVCPIVIMPQELPHKVWDTIDSAILAIKQIEWLKTMEEYE